METLILTYFAINIFIAGYNYSEDGKWETRTRAVFGLFIISLFGSIFVIFYYLSVLFSPIFNWIRYEIVFQYKFHFTKYWDDIMSADKHRTAEEKIESIERLHNNPNATKQFKRHSKMIYNKFK